MAQFPAFEGLVEGPRKMRGASDVPMSSPCFTMNVNSPSCPCRKTLRFVVSEPSRCLVHEKALLISVSEFKWDFPRDVRRHPMRRCASIAPSLLLPRRKPCQFGEKCSSPPSVVVSQCDAGAQHSFLSVAFVNQGDV